MRRTVLMVGLALTVFMQSGTASADWQSIKTKWHCYWDRVHLDWHRNNAWPEPFVQVDRKAVLTPLEIMTDKGWQLQNTIPHQLFDAETQELTRAGQLKVQLILTQMPTRRRMVFVLKGKTAEITETRLRSVEKAAVEVMGDAATNMIAVTDVIPRDGSGAYYERINAVTSQQHQHLAFPTFRRRAKVGSGIPLVERDGSAGLEQLPPLVSRGPSGGRHKRHQIYGGRLGR